MVTTKHCCYGQCKNDSRKLGPDSGIFFIGFGNGFPDKQKEKCLRWVHNCGRKYFTIDNITKDTYICSVHFVGGKGPTEQNPDPIKCGQIYEVARKRKSVVRKEYKSPKQQRLEVEEAAAALLVLQEKAVHENNINNEVVEEVKVDKYKDFAVMCKPNVKSQGSQTHASAVSEATQIAVKTKIKEKSRTTSKSEMSNNMTGSTGECSVEKFKRDDNCFKFYTGLTYLQFLCLWNFLEKATTKITYWSSSIKNPELSPCKRTGPKKTISLQDQLLMTLMRLRLGLLNQDLAFRFRTNTRQVSTIIITWIQLLYKQFLPLKRPMFASRHKIKKHIPKCFKKYKNIRCIIDCTEVHVQSPGDFKAQGNQYSSYKGYTSNKFLVAIAPNGAIMYVSDAFEGSISDKEIVKQSGFLDYVEPGDVIMADRGFLIDDELNERQATLIRPPFLGSRKHLTPQEEAATKDIAKHRIHVERSIERMKKFKFLSRTVPQSLQPVFSQSVFVIACLVNFQTPLVK